MSDSLTRKFPQGTKRLTTGCQYCAVGCGYNAFLVREGDRPEEISLSGVSRFITPAMTNVVKYKGQTYRVAVAPDARCDLNKGNHSVRGGSQGENLVTSHQRGRSTEDRLKSPMVRLASGELEEITWETLNQVMGHLIVSATEMESQGDTIRVHNPSGLGVKLYEYQYLENTYAATKLFYSGIGTPNVAYHDRPSAAGSSPGMEDVGFRPHDFSYDEVRESDILIFLGTNPYENQSVFFMQYCVGKEMIVIDPRRTATAQYAATTGGLHLQPKKLGADSLVLYAIAREVLKRWLKVKENTLSNFPWKDRFASSTDVEQLRYSNPGENTKDKAARMRRASRAVDFVSFAEEFLQIYDDRRSPYTLDQAAQATEIDLSNLEAVVSRIFNPNITDSEQQPRVGIFYEKGLIWGFNYHNTSAVASLGLLLGAYSEPGRFVGRVGGHQKGWAESKADLSDLFDNHQGSSLDYREGYPFRNVSDRYTDSYLEQTFPNHDEIEVHHNLDNHVFGPPPNFEHPNQRGVPAGSVRLRNGLTTQQTPEVKLLWIIGGNYFGQTNDSQRKRLVLERRLQVAGSPNSIRRPKNASAAAIIEALTTRLEAGGLVIVDQELFPNPTSEYGDLLIPAVGWGEDTFCRYNAQRRLKLFTRFQDLPLHPADEGLGDPHQRMDTFAHSPKPDWLIIRDIARAIGRTIDLENSSKESGIFEQRMVKAFPWQNSSELADEMARNSHRGLAGANNKGQSLLGDLYLYGISRQIPAEDGILHTVLGKSKATEPANALAPYLTGYFNDDEEKPYYSIPDESKVYGNGIASNGVILPIRSLDSAGNELEVKVKDANGQLTVEKVKQRAEQTIRIQGTLRVPRQKPFFFITAHWQEIQPDFERINHHSGHADEVFVTNGRFNHLWNNMFHHLRNDYVNDRYPEDLPGTVLEINPEWAQRREIENGQLLSVGTGSSRFIAIASLQRSVPDGGAFALFSYPVRQQGRFTFDGFANNVTDGYCDGINPIAAVKYGRAVIQKAVNPNDGTKRWIFPEHFPQRVPRLGPTFEERNQIRPEPQPQIEPPQQLTEAERTNWEMRELIVTKGLPRAFVHRSFKFPFPSHAITNRPGAVIPTGRFWRIPGLTPGEFLNMRIFGERVGDALLDRLQADMPSGMLNPGVLPSYENTMQLLEKARDLLAHPEQFHEPQLAELQQILDTFIDLPHRAVAELFLDPERFMTLLESQSEVRERFIARLSPGPRIMNWQEGEGVTDEWTPSELAIARTWYQKFQR